MDFEKNLQKSIDLYLNNFGFIFLACLTAWMLSVVSLGALAGPLFGGLMMLILKLVKNKPTKFKEIFSHFDKLLPTLIYTMISLIFFWIIDKLSVFGVLLAIVLCPFLLVTTTFAFILIVDKNFTPLQAITEVIAFFKTDPIIIWIYALITSILSTIGAVGFGVGIVLTLPFSVICMTVAYQDYSEKGFNVSHSDTHQKKRG